MTPPSSTNIRVPWRVYRSPTQTNSRPLHGWNGCVTRTRCVVLIGSLALRLELQAAVEGAVSLVA